MSEPNWGIREGVGAYAILVFVSGLASIAMIFTLDDPSQGMDLENPRVLMGMILATIVGMVSALFYALNKAGRDAFRWGPLEMDGALLSVAMVIPVLGFGYGWTLFMETLGFEALPQTIVQGILETPSMAVLIMAGTYGIVGAALFEEMLFRGFIQPPCVSRFGVVWGVLMTSMLFGLIHASDPWAIIPTMVIGGVAGWLRERTGGLGAPIIFHGTNNLVALILTVAAG